VRWGLINFEKSFLVNFKNSPGFPRHNPKIVGLKPLYDIKDFIEATCLTDTSFPPPKISWYINNELVSRNLAISRAKSLGNLIKISCACARIPPPIHPHSK
jgi:hypothetical protein